MNDIAHFFDHPPVHEPVMLLALDGWVDAGVAASAAMQAILASHSWETIVEFDSDQLLDHRARRPIMSLVNGVMTELTWPSTEIRALTDAAGRHVIAVVGAEPDHAWGMFVGAVRDVAVDLGVRSVVGIGAYPAAVPHTRDPQLALTSPSVDVLDGLPGFVRGTVEVPAGVHAAIEMSTHQAGIPTMAVWAQVPHYIAGITYPAASVAIIDSLDRLAGLSFDIDPLREDAKRGRQQIDELVDGNDQHREMVQQLEQLFDSQGIQNLGPLPTGDQLAAELQEFLRNQGDA